MRISSLAAWCAAAAQAAAVGSDGACLNASFVLPRSRRVAAPIHADAWQDQIRALAQNATALEVGGPTTTFGELYLLPWKSVDIVNISPEAGAVHVDDTKGVGGAQHGSVFYVGQRALGTLLVWHGADLAGVPDGFYDVVMAFHVLEHFADPLRALEEWHRVLRPGGALVLSVPWAPATYDRDVPVSTIYDLLLDYADDLNAYRPEIAAGLERRAAAYMRHVDRSNCDNCPDPSVAHQNAGFHWHVWDLALLEDTMACLGYAVEHLSVVDHWHQFLIARKPPAGP